VAAVPGGGGRVGRRLRRAWPPRPRTLGVRFAAPGAGGCGWRGVMVEPPRWAGWSGSLGWPVGRVGRWQRRVLAESNAVVASSRRRTQRTRPGPGCRCRPAPQRPADRSTTRSLGRGGPGEAAASASTPCALFEPPASAVLSGLPVAAVAGVMAHRDAARASAISRTRKIRRTMSDLLTGPVVRRSCSWRSGGSRGHPAGQRSGTWGRRSAGAGRGRAAPWPPPGRWPPSRGSPVAWSWGPPTSRWPRATWRPGRLGHPGGGRRAGGRTTYTGRAAPAAGYDLRPGVPRWTASLDRPGRGRCARR
jgi:hypothetical protein